MFNSHIYIFDSSMFPFATIGAKTIQSSSMAGGPTKELIEATSLEGF
jgi:hypothetical protein